MTLSLAQLKNAEPVLSNLMKQTLPFSTSFKITKLIEAVAPDLENFEKHRIQLFDKYGELQSDNNKVILSENIEAFTQDLNSLLQVTVEIPEIKFTLTELENVQIAPGDLMFFTPWIADTQKDTI